MIILIIAEDPEIKKRFSSFFPAVDYSILHYRHPLKAMDNFDEISPDIVFCCASDYPRHWKILIRELRESYQRDKAIFILQVDNQFLPEEADKAIFLGVNVLHAEPLEIKSHFQLLKKRIERYKSSPDHQPQNAVWVPRKDNPIVFLFKHPDDYRIISGQLEELSASGGLFNPYMPEDIQELETGRVIEDASLRLDNVIINLKARIIHYQNSLSLAFIYFYDDGFSEFLEKIESHTHRLKSSHLDA